MTQVISLQRQTDKGLPYYTDYPEQDGIDNDKDGETDEADEWDTTVYSNGEELVSLADGAYRLENESERYAETFFGLSPLPGRSRARKECRWFWPRGEASGGPPTLRARLVFANETGRYLFGCLDSSASLRSPSSCYVLTL